MKDYEKKIISKLLEMSAELFSNRGCNDTSNEILDLMTEEEKNDLDNRIAKWNHEPEESGFINYDFVLMNYFSDELKK